MNRDIISVDPPATTRQTQPFAPGANEPPREERNTMARKPRTTTTRSESKTDTHHNGNGNGSALKSLAEQAEQIRESLKGIVRELAMMADTVKQAEKEKRNTEKEIDAIRSKLRQIQNVSI